MIKKIGFLLLSLFAIFGFGVSLANPLIPGEPRIEYTPQVCNKLENVEIDNYRAIILTTKGNQSYRDFLNGLPNSENLNGDWNFYIPKKNVCVEKGGQLFLIDKSTKIKDVTPHNIIHIGSIASSNCTPNCDEIKTYKIINERGVYEQEYIGIQFIKDIGTQGETFSKFLIARLIAIIVETTILFAIAKLFRKKENIPNWKLILYGIIPTTITLPLLWFVLPLIIGEGIRYTIIGELLITIIEAIILKYGLKISRRKAIIASVVCNVASYVVGLLIL